VFGAPGGWGGGGGPGGGGPPHKKFIILAGVAHLFAAFGNCFIM
jgi:hypothetical protein